jgi:hypothetical protein
LIRIWVDGYIELQPIPVRLPSGGNVSIVYSMERASRVSGIVLGPDLNDRALLLSWAVIDLEPGNFTTFSLDGGYQLWVPSGSYNVGVSLSGYSTYTARFEVSSGSDIEADFWLDNPGLPSSYFAHSLLAIGTSLMIAPFTWLALISQRQRPKKGGNGNIKIVRAALY